MLKAFFVATLPHRTTPHRADRYDRFQASYPHLFQAGQLKLGDSKIVDGGVYACQLLVFHTFSTKSIPFLA